MKKNFVKKLALVMTMALAVSAVAPAANTASAAAAPAFKSTTANLKVGETKKYNVANSGNYSLAKAVVGTKSIASVVKGGAGKGATKYVKITGIKEGKTTVRAELKNYATKKVTAARISVVVKSTEISLSSAAQTKFNKVVLAYSGELSAVTLSDFVIRNKETNVIMAVKAADLDSKDKTKVTLTLYGSVLDGKAYTVTDGKKTVEFTATDAVVADVAITPLTVPATVQKDIYVQTIDAKGIVISEDKFNAPSSNKVTASITTNDGYTDGSKLYLNEVGKVATAKVEYHTYTYDSTTGAETGLISKEFTITAVKDDTTVSSFKYTIGANAPYWATAFEADTKVAVGETGKNIYVKVTDSSDADVTANYSISSADTSKVIVAQGALTGSAAGVAITGVTTGSTYIILKDKNGTVVASLPVVVVAERKATTVSFDVNGFSISTTTGITQAVKVTVKDQYGDKMTSAVVTDATNISKPTTTLPSGLVSYTGDVVTVDAKNATAVQTGSYAYKVTAMVNNVSVSNTLNFKISATDATVDSYKLIVSSSNVDTTVASNAAAGDDEREVIVQLATVRNGAVNGYAAASSVAITKADGTKVCFDDGNSSNLATSAAVTSSAAINLGNGASLVTATALGVSGGDFTKNLTPGTYIVKVVRDTTTYTTTFVVEDNQPKVTVDFITDGDSNASLTSILQNDSHIKYYYNGVQLNSSSVVLAATDKIGQVGNWYVKKVTIDVKVNSAVTIKNVPVTMERSFKSVD